MSVELRVTGDRPLTPVVVAAPPVVTPAMGVALRVATSLTPMEVLPVVGPVMVMLALVIVAVTPGVGAVALPAPSPWMSKPMAVALLPPYEPPLTDRPTVGTAAVPLL